MCVAGCSEKSGSRSAILKLPSLPTIVSNDVPWKFVIAVTMMRLVLIETCKSSIKDLKCDFYKRSEGNVHFICKEARVITEAVNKTISKGERVNLPVKVIATVPDKFGDEPVAEFTITLSMKEKSY